MLQKIEVIWSFLSFSFVSIIMFMFSFFRRSWYLVSSFLLHLLASFSWLFLSLVSYFPAMTWLSGTTSIRILASPYRHLPHSYSFLWNLVSPYWLPPHFYSFLYYLGTLLLPTGFTLFLNPFVCILFPKAFSSSLYRCLFECLAFSSINHWGALFSL